MTPTLTKLGLLAAAAAVMSGCATQEPVVASPAPAAAPAVAAAPAAAAPATADLLFAVLPESGRIHAFGDSKNYFDFLSHGEVTLTRTRVGEGPGGRTLVYGITGDDVKANRPSLGEQLMAGSVAPAPNFYGEVAKDGRYYVFGSLKDMQDFLHSGEVAYSYTDVGVGPQGETLVYVMNKDSYPKGKPTVRSERFKSLRVAAK